MLHTLWLIALFCITPAGVMWLCRRFPILNQLGPIMILYAVGLVIGNLPRMPLQLATVQEILPNVVIPLAIPMMLFGCRFSRHALGLQIKLVVSGFFSVAFINSPPFVPMVSAAMQNKNSLVTGLGVGIVGYALGNHFGVLMAELLCHL